MNDVTVYYLLRSGATVYLRMPLDHADDLIEKWVRHNQGLLKEWGQVPVIAGIGFGILTNEVVAIYHSSPESREKADLEDKVQIASLKATLKRLEEEEKYNTDPEN
jgi:hypothetical protein